MQKKTLYYYATANWVVEKVLEELSKKHPGVRAESKRTGSSNCGTLTISCNSRETLSCATTFVVCDDFFREHFHETRR